jgi:hypothetical protein
MLAPAKMPLWRRGSPHRRESPSRERRPWPSPRAQRRRARPKPPSPLLHIRHAAAFGGTDEDEAGEQDHRQDIGAWTPAPAPALCPQGDALHAIKMALSNPNRKVARAPATVASWRRSGPESDARPPPARPKSLTGRSPDSTAVPRIPDHHGRYGAT